jgi:hypothetical protein
LQGKGKVVASPSSPSSDSTKLVSSRMQPRDDCSHVISEIKPQVPPNLRLIQGSPKGTKLTEEGFPLKMENMDFDLYLFGQQTIFFDNVVILDII